MAWKTRGWLPTTIGFVLFAVLALGIVYFTLYPSAVAQGTQETSPGASSYELEFQTVNLSGTVGGSANYSVEDAITHMGNGSDVQSSDTYSVGSLFQTEEITGIGDQHWTGLR